MIFNEGFIDTELFWLSFGGVISNMVMATVIIMEIGFVIWLLLRWLHGNININWSPTLNVGESVRSRVDSPIETFKERVKRDMGPVEVGVKKNIIIDKVDNKSIKMDKIEKKKVKNNKEKLKKLLKG